MVNVKVQKGTCYRVSSNVFVFTTILSCLNGLFGIVNSNFDISFLYKQYLWYY